MNPISSRLSPEEIALFQAMKKSATVFLLMQHLGRPAGAREIADILGIHEQTATRYLRRLEALRLVRRHTRKNGYVILDLGALRFNVKAPLLLNAQNTQNPREMRGLVDRDSLPEDISPAHETAQFSQYPQDLMIYSQNGIEAQDFTAVDSGLNQLSRDPAVKYSQNQEDITFFSQDPVRERGGSARDSHSGNLPCAPATVQIAQNQEDTTFFSQYPAINTTTSTDINFNLIDSEVVVIDQTPQKTQKSKAAIYSGIWHELYNAGIGPNPRTRALARLPHMTAEYVRRHRLGLEAAGMGGRQWTGLLVRILESGQPPPELNPNERLSDCVCPNPVENTVAGSPTPGKVHSRWR